MTCLKERIEVKLKRINEELGRKPRLTEDLWNNIDCFRGHESQPESLVYVKVGRGLIIALDGDVDGRGWHKIRTLDQYPNHRITYKSELYMILDKLIDNLFTDKSSVNTHSKKNTTFQQINTDFDPMFDRNYLMNFLQEHASKDRVTLLEELFDANAVRDIGRSEIALNAIVEGLKQHYDLVLVYHLSKVDFFNRVDHLGGKTGLVTLETIRELVHSGNVRLAEVIEVTHTQALKDTEVPVYLTEWLLEYYIGITVSLTSQKD